MDRTRDPGEQEGQGVCVGSGGDSGSEQFLSQGQKYSAMAGTNNNGRVQEGDQHFREAIPRAVCDFSPGPGCFG